MGGMFDNVRGKAEEAAANNPEKVEEFSDRAIQTGGDAADSATGGRFAGQVDSVQEQADQRVGE